MLNEAEIALLVRTCRDHEVAFCNACQKAYRLSELGWDPMAGHRFDYCGACRNSVEASVRAHLQDCPLIRAELARERSGIITKESAQLVDTSRVLVAESQERIQYRLNAGTCLVCRNAIHPGQERYHFPAGDFHVHCFQEEKKKSSKGPCGREGEGAKTVGRTPNVAGGVHD